MSSNNNDPNNHHKESRKTGGIKGFFTGNQSLASAFWLVGVLPAALVSAFLGLVSTTGNLNGAEFLLLMFGLTIPLRLIAWFSIFRCIGNTSNAIWSFLAGAVVGIDILHKLVFWPIVWFAYQESVENRENPKPNQNVESCRAELSKRVELPLDKIHFHHFDEYPVDEEPFYLFWFQKGDFHYFKCRIGPEGIELERRE